MAARKKAAPRAPRPRVAKIAAEKDDEIAARLGELGDVGDVGDLGTNQPPGIERPVKKTAE